MKRLRIVLLLLVAGAAALILLGPKAETPELQTASVVIDQDLRQLEQEIQVRESQIPGIKPDNEARFIWADSFAYKKSPYSLVYLHGFSASQGEGIPVHRAFAERYQCNAYLSRLDQHGIAGEDELLHLTPEGYLASAQEAIAIGKAIGEKVIVMSTSTGGTLALYLAAGDPDIAGLICYSPNIQIYDSKASMLLWPWGLQIARAVTGGKYRQTEAKNDTVKQYWNTRYRLESLVALQNLVAHTMKPEVFAQVEAPLFLGYYYVSDSVQDQVVSVPKMLEMYEQLGTPEALKRKVAFTEVGEHALASRFQSEDIGSVLKETFAFAEEILGWVPVSAGEEGEEKENDTE